MKMLTLSKREPTRTQGHQQQTECPCPLSQSRPADAGTRAVGAVTSVHPGPPSLGGMARGDRQGLGPQHSGPEPSSAAAADGSRGWSHTLYGRAEGRTDGHCWPRGPGVTGRPTPETEKCLGRNSSGEKNDQTVPQNRSSLPPRSARVHSGGGIHHPKRLPDGRTPRKQPGPGGQAGEPGGWIYNSAAASQECASPSHSPV